MHTIEIEERPTIHGDMRYYWAIWQGSALIDNGSIGRSDADDAFDDALVFMPKNVPYVIRRI